jgi:hypothetical protein
MFLWGGGSFRSLLTPQTDGPLHVGSRDLLFSIYPLEAVSFIPNLRTLHVVLIVEELHNQMEQDGSTFPVQMSARAPTIISEIFRGFPQSLYVDAGTIP